MRGARYHGGFDHPVRSFVIGVALLVLLFGGFVVGVEAGTHPLEQAAATKLVEQVSMQTVTQRIPVVRAVIDGHTRVIRIPSGIPSVTTRLVVIHRGGRIIVRREALPDSAASSGPQNAAAPTVYSTVTTVVTTTETVTEPGSTVTVTDTGTTDTSGSSNSSTTTP